MSDLPVGTVTFLFTDVEGSTRLWERYPETMQAALERHDALLAKGIEQHGGVLVKTRGEGDSVFAVFRRATDAVMAACSLQYAFSTEPWSTPTPLRVRMAIHSGEAELRAGDYYGSAVNRCARLRSIAHGGQVLLSLSTEELIRDHLPEGVSLRSLGSHRLQDLRRPEQVFQLLHPDLANDFPPLRSLDALPNNLPVELTSFVGREAEIREVRQLHFKARLLSLIGSGGCGKTRLAIQVAADLLEEYPDGVWLVELASLGDPELVSQVVAHTVGVREEPGRPIIQTLQDHFQTRTMLIVLDNCEHLMASVTELISGLLRGCPRLRIVTTSREALGIIGETVWRVPSLTVPDLRCLPAHSAYLAVALQEYEAVRLFVERARLSQPSFGLTEENAAAVARTVRRLDGIPLAIELAAARVRVLTVDQIHARLDDCFRLLTGGSRSALPRHQTLRAAMEWSYRLLSEPEQALLRRLAVFAGGFSLEAAESACCGDGVDEWEVLDLLSQLVDKSLVIAEDGPDRSARYRLLESVRQYALERLTETGDAGATRSRHAAFFLAQAEEAEPNLSGPDQARWLDRLEAEHDNLRAALAWVLSGAREAFDRGDSPPLHPAEAALRFCAALWRFWHIRGHVREGREWLEAALADREACRTLRARALHGAGVLAHFQGSFADARRFHEESLATQRELGNREGIAASLTGLAWVAHHEGDFDTARALHQESLAIHRELGNSFGIAQALNNLGHVARDSGGDQAADALYEESLSISRKIRNRSGIAASLNSLGLTARDRGDLVTARHLFEESLAIRRELGNRHGMALCQHNLSRVAAEQGDLPAAESLAAESLKTLRELGDRWGIALVLETVAVLAAKRARARRALELFGAASALRDSIGAPLTPAARGELDGHLEPARQALTSEELTAALAGGRSMSVDHAIERALASDSED